MNLLRLLTASAISTAILLAGGFHGVQATPALQDDDASGVIEGSVFLDEDADGRFDPDEEPLEGFEVRLEGADERTTMTPTNGRYRFENLPAGDYTVLVERNDEQRETYVSSIRYENLEVDGTLLVGIDFGLQERDAEATASEEAVADEGEDEAMADATDDAAATDSDDKADEDEDMDADDAAGDEAEDTDVAAMASNEATPEMTAANMLPALREMLQSAASAGQTVEDLDPAARSALDDAIADLSAEERVELQRAIAEDKELSDLARATGADALLAAAMDAEVADQAAGEALIAPTAAPKAQVNDMPQAGAEDLLGWQGLVGLIALLALMGAAGMAAERRAI